MRSIFKKFRKQYIQYFLLPNSQSFVVRAFVFELLRDQIQGFCLQAGALIQEQIIAQKVRPKNLIFGAMLKLIR